MAELARTTGFTLEKDGASLWDRLSKDETPGQPVAHLFALHDVRILKAHKASDQHRELQEELKRFDIKAGEEGAGYGRILDRVYDALSEEVTAITAAIKLAA
ncbi:hypothetical protein [Bradyrhizobium sp. BR 1433]|uniref:hypothetical protein n=1 Tax=Bradyrhizobium sp. BR 1433 TaxID=3447967 RepID=UPI003EE5D474